MQHRKFAWIPDGYKAKDYDAGVRLRTFSGPTLPATVSQRRLIPDVLDQKSLGSCTMNAVAQAVRASTIAHGMLGVEILSRLWGYYFARCIVGDPKADTGTQIRACFDVIRKLGYCRESQWPYDISRFAQFPPGDTMRAAADQASMVGYYRINTTGDIRIRDIMTALANGYLVVFGTLVSSKFAAFKRGSEPLRAPEIDEPILGGHALTIVGYTTLPTGQIAFDVLNSWGKEYGDEGYCLFHESYLKASISDDFWIVEALPNFSE